MKVLQRVLAASAFALGIVAIFWAQWGFFHIRDPNWPIGARVILGVLVVLVVETGLHGRLSWEDDHRLGWFLLSFLAMGVPYYLTYGTSRLALGFVCGILASAPFLFLYQRDRKRFGPHARKRPPEEL